MAPTSRIPPPPCFVSFHLFEPRALPPLFPTPSKCHSIGHVPLRKAKYRFIDSRLPSPFLILESVFNGSDPGRPQSASFSFLPIFSRPRNRLLRMLSILWLSVYDYKIRVLWSHVYPDSFFFLLHRTIAIKFAFPAQVSSIRRWITAHLEWTDTWETLMDWFLRDSWFRNYRVLLRFFEPLLSELNWNRSDFSVDFVDLVWILFFWGGERDIIVLFELGKLVIVDRIEFYIGTKKKNYFERFCVMKRKFLYSFFLLSSFLIQEQDTWVAIRTEGIRCISCINSSV